MGVKCSLIRMTAFYFHFAQDVEQRELKLEVSDKKIKDTTSISGKS